MTAHESAGSLAGATFASNRLHWEGRIAQPLIGAVPSVAGWRLATLPKALTSRDVRALLATCDRRRATGRRDFAVLTLLARLGLRAGEVAALQLDDVNWRAGTIVVRGKGHRLEPLPVPSDVGTAVADYLRRARPTTALDRSLFVRVKAPHRALTAGGVSGIVAGAARAGRTRPNSCASAPTYRRDDPTASWCLAPRNWPAPPTSADADHGDLRQSRSGRPSDDRATVARRCRMRPMQQALVEYLTMRRALGYKLKRAEQLLRQFVTYVEQRGETRLHLPTMLAWATLPGHEESGWAAHRLGIVRRFASYLHAIDPTNEVPASDVLPRRSMRATPYLYSDGDVCALMAATATLRTSHRVATYRTLIDLLAVTGMRVGEALALDRDQIDAVEGVLTVRDAKTRDTSDCLPQGRLLNPLPSRCRLNDSPG
jgi:site-specific recombinase XerD